MPRSPSVTLLLVSKRQPSRTPLRGSDNFPNPIATAANPYVPVNSPAIDDLMGLSHALNG
jgi:hypothetical protein